MSILQTLNSLQAVIAFMNLPALPQAERDILQQHADAIEQSAHYSDRDIDFFRHELLTHANIKCVHGVYTITADSQKLYSETLLALAHIVHIPEHGVSADNYVFDDAHLEVTGLCEDTVKALLGPQCFKLFHAGHEKKLIQNPETHLPEKPRSAVITKQLRDAVVFYEYPASDPGFVHLTTTSAFAPDEIYPGRDITNLEVLQGYFRSGQVTYSPELSKASPGSSPAKPATDNEPAIPAVTACVFRVDAESFAKSYLFHQGRPSSPSL